MHLQNFPANMFYIYIYIFQVNKRHYEFSSKYEIFVVKFVYNKSRTNLLIKKPKMTYNKKVFHRIIIIQYFITL